MIKFPSFRLAVRAGKFTVLAGANCLAGLGVTVCRGNVPVFTLASTRGYPFAPPNGLFAHEWLGGHIRWTVGAKAARASASKNANHNGTVTLH